MCSETHTRHHISKHSQQLRTQLANNCKIYGKAIAKPMQTNHFKFKQYPSSLKTAALYIFSSEISYRVPLFCSWVSLTLSKERCPRNIVAILVFWCSSPRGAERGTWHLHVTLVNLAWCRLFLSGNSLLPRNSMRLDSAFVELLAKLNGIFLLRF